MIPEINGDFLQWLRGFYYTAQEGSVSAAALIMGRSQSTVSHQIMSLQRELGVQLFERIAGRMCLTEEGERLHQQAVVIFESVQAMREDIASTGRVLTGRVSIATTHAVLLYFLAEHVVHFRRDHPGVDINLDGGGVDHILTRVRSATADLGIACLSEVPEGLVFEPLFRTMPMLISPLNDPWELGRSLTIEKIATCPFISFPESSTIAQTVNARFVQAGLSLNRIQVLNHFELVKRYVELGLGVAILDDYALEGGDEDRLFILPLGDIFKKRTYGIITRHRGYLSPAVRAFRRRIIGQV